MPEDDPWRPVSNDEIALLEAILRLDFEGAIALRRQVEGAEARRGCACGCGTLDLRVHHGGPADLDYRKAPGELRVIDDQGTVIGDVILFLDAGLLSSLEVVSYSADPLPLPRPSEVETFLI